MLILLILYFLQNEAAAYSHLRNHVNHKSHYDTTRIFDPNTRKVGYNGMDYTIKSRYTWKNNDIETNYTETDNNINKEHINADKSNMGTKFAGMDKIQSSLDNLLTEFSTFVTVEEKTLLTDIIELVEYLKIRLPTRLSGVMRLLRAIYILFQEALGVFLYHLPEELSIVNYIFKFLSSVLSGRLIEDLSKNLEEGQGLYSIPQKVMSKLSFDGTFSKDLLGVFGEPLFEIVTKLNTWAVEVLENITPLLPFEELNKLLDLGANNKSLNRTSDLHSTAAPGDMYEADLHSTAAPGDMYEATAAPGDMYEAYQNTLKLYPKLDELTLGTGNYHLSKSLFKVMTRLLKLIYKHN